MSAPGDDLLRSLAEFQDVLRRTPFIGASRIAEEAQPRVLIGKYPDAARQMLAELDRPAAGN
ncbi:hypothetical protein GCM10023196_091600 [Actinoallomurus vinaceus]|uniref:Uncharacterized protein n=1 Tax=Actinoallomurus vinaceus TaxID=1080074 RepID=A0ABP8UR72_9ACTN